MDGPGCPLTEGERWARAELGKLLDARFSPIAVARFLARSQGRAGAVRRARPELARQEAAWLAAGAGACFVAQGASLRWWVAVGLMLDWHLGMVESPEGEPQPLGPADALTLARAWLVPVALHDPSATVVTAGWATDVLDGVAARARLGGCGPTRAGRDLEGLVDACFGAAVLVGLRRRERLGAAPVALEVGRVGVGFGYAVAVWFGRAAPPDRAVLGAARSTTAVRAAGMLAAAAGHRRAADALLTAGSLASLALLATHGRREPHPTLADDAPAARLPDHGPQPCRVLLRRRRPAQATRTGRRPRP